MLASQHQPAWASKSPSNPSSPAMFPPQQIAGLFVKRIFRQPLLVSTRYLYWKIREIHGVRQKSDGMMPFQWKKMRSLNLQILRQVVTWLKPGFEAWWKLLQTVKPLVNRRGKCFLYYSLPKM